MEFKNTDELKEYIHKRAIERTKFKLVVYSLKAKDKTTKTSNETLNEIFKASLLEIKKEITEEIANGSIVVLNNSPMKKTKTK